MDVRIVRWWAVCFSSGNSRSPSLVQVLTNTACRLLFPASENGGDYDEKECFVAENLLHQIELLSPLYLGSVMIGTTYEKNLS